MKVVVIDNFDSFTYNLVEYVSEIGLDEAANAGSELHSTEFAESTTQTTDLTGSTEPSAELATESATERDQSAPMAASEIGTIDISVFKNTTSLETITDADPDAILISPGPGHPKNDRDVGVTADVLHELSPEIPTLGVCLGLEAAVYEYGGTVGHAPEPIHGKAYPVDHDGEGVFAGLDQGFRAGRYHSLAAIEVPDVFKVSATTDHDGESIVMGIRHKTYPIEAVQFHPESVLTAVGHDVIRNFLRSA